MVARCGGGGLRRSAFTLVELLVVIAIIGILVALLLPAIQAAREASRRSSCSNNLKQIGMACQNYHDAFKRLPWNSDLGNNGYPGFPSGRWNEFSWIVAALPYMEQQGLYNSFNFNVYDGNNNNAVGNPTNQVLRQAVLANLICPSNSQPALRNNQCGGYQDFANSNAGGSDYVGCLGYIRAGWKDNNATDNIAPGPAEFPGMFVVSGGALNATQGTAWVNGEVWTEQVNCTGVFQFMGASRLADVTDGTSSTIAVFEDMHWRGFINGSTTVFDYSYCDDSAWASGLACVNSLKNPMNNKNPAWAAGSPLNGGYGNGDRRCHGWSSLHPGGAHAVLCDGGVRFFSENLDHAVRYKLANRNDGLVIATF